MPIVHRRKPADPNHKALSLSALNYDCKSISRCQGLIKCLPVVVSGIEEYTSPRVLVDATLRSMEQITMATEILRSGNIAPVSGQFPVVGPRGGFTGVERTAIKGKPLPPTPKAGQGYGKPDKTKTS